MKRNKILISGGTGFIGKYIVNKLIHEYQIILLTRNKKVETTLFSKNIEFLNLKNFLKSKDNIKVNGFIHLATNYGHNSKDSEIYCDNLIIPIKIIEKIQYKNLMFIINTRSFFEKKYIIYDHLKNYTLSKKFFYNYFYLKKDFFIENNVKVINVCLEHVYGPNDNENKFVTNIINKIKNNNEYIDLTKGDQKRDFIHVEDVAEAYYFIIKNYDNLNSFEEFEIGTGKPISIKNFVEEVKKKTKSLTKLNFGKIEIRNNEFKSSKANISKLTKIGWNYKYDFKNGINNIINSFDNEKS